MMKNIYLLLFTVLLFSGTQAQSRITGLRQGKLENGLTYYVQHSTLQPGKVSFYLVQNVGAILEEDGEIGLAHFLEHMAFNGTEHFPDGLMPYLRGEGFYTFNAHTGINETVYNLDDIPLNNRALVDTCLDIIKDWSNGILLKDKDIDDERGIIIEELRSRHTLSRRLTEAAAPYIYNHSKYGVRNVIGTVENLKAFPADTLRAFYRKWYRPDLQCVIIVGDIDEEEWTNKLREQLGQIPAATDAPARYNITIDENEAPIYKLLLDAENRSKSITLHQRIAKVKHDSEESRRAYSLSARFFTQLWQNRLNRLRNSNEEKFLSASVRFSSFARGYNGFTIEITPFERQDSAAFDQMWTLWEQIRRQGFTADEVKQLQESEYKNLEELQRNADKNRNNYYVGIFKNHFLNGVPYYSPEEEVEKLMETVLEYTPEKMKQWIDSWADNRNITVIADGNTPDYPYLTEKQVNQILKKVSTKELHQQQQARAIPTLFDLNVRPGKITKIKKIKPLEAEIWKLSNGAQVVYKEVPEGRGTFSLVCSSHGGRSVVEAEDLPSLDAMQALVLQSGLYKFDRNTIQDIIRGKKMSANLFLNEWTEGLGGIAMTGDAELYFQFIHLMFEQPRFTREQFDKFVQRRRFIYENTPQTPLKAVQDSIRHLTTLTSTRSRDFDLSYINDMDFSKVERLYRERFSNGKDFIFCIVGDIPREEAEEMTCRYLATIPSTKAKKEKFIIHEYSANMDSIVREFDIHAPEEKGIIDISFSNEMKFSDREQLAFTIYGLMLRNRYFRIIREEQSGAYGVNVQTNYSIFPKLSESLAINFETDPAKASALRSIALKELHRSHTTLFTPNELKAIVISMKQDKEMQENNKGLDYWMNVLNYYVEFGIDLTSPDHFEDIIDSITPEDIQKVAQKFFDGAKKKDILIKITEEEDKGSIF